MSSKAASHWSQSPSQWGSSSFPGHVAFPVVFKQSSVTLINKRDLLPLHSPSTSSSSSPSTSSSSSSRPTSWSSSEEEDDDEELGKEAGSHWSVVQLKKHSCSVCGVNFALPLDDAAKEKIYSSHRAAFRKLACQKQKLSKQAAKAYAERQSGIAGQFALQAHQVSKEMEEQRTQAAQGIFEHFNNKHARNPRKIDVHGLHAEEAQHYVMGRLDHLSRFDVGELIVITGVGNHSLGRSMIHPALITMLEAGKYAFDQSRAGLIVIRVKH